MKSLCLLLLLSVSPAFAQDISKPHLENGEVTEINYYRDGDSRPYRRDVLKPKYGVPAIYRITYASDRSSDFTINELEIYNLKDEFQKLVKINFGTAENEPDIQNENQGSPKVLILDSGFFGNHSQIKDEHFLIRGQGGAGGSVKYFYNDDETLKLPPEGKGAPMSHGTFVASVAFKNIDHTTFIGAAGDIYSSVFLFKLIEIIKQNDVRFTNMSFGFGDRDAISLVDREDHYSLEHFIKNQASVLHVIAAGNHGLDFDKSKYSEYPACIRSPYSITVGGLATDKIDEERLSTYVRSSGSSYGIRCLDLMAPAEEVEGASIWPETMRASGTSVASPYVLNVLLKMHKENSQLKPIEYKELLLKTVYVPKNKSFAVRSGGIVHPRRAILATQLFKDGLSIDQAVVRARDIISDPREINHYPALLKLWKTNKLYRKSQ